MNICKKVWLTVLMLCTSGLLHPQGEPEAVKQGKLEVYWQAAKQKAQDAYQQIGMSMQDALQKARITYREHSGKINAAGALATALAIFKLGMNYQRDHRPPNLNRLYAVMTVNTQTGQSSALQVYTPRGHSDRRPLNPSHPNYVGDVRLDVTDMSNKPDYEFSFGKE